MIPRITRNVLAVADRLGAVKEMLWDEQVFVESYGDGSDLIGLRRYVHAPRVYFQLQGTPDADTLLWYPSGWDLYRDEEPTEEAIGLDLTTEQAASVRDMYWKEAPELYCVCSRSEGAIFLGYRVEGRKGDFCTLRIQPDIGKAQVSVSFEWSGGGTRGDVCDARTVALAAEGMAEASRIADLVQSAYQHCAVTEKALAEYDKCLPPGMETYAREALNERIAQILDSGR